jgi:drug/metabolite transporter (DMT)-like permease
MRPSASPIAVWAGIVVLYLVWGSTYLGIKLAIETVPPFLMGFLRFVVAGALLSGAVAFRNRATIRRPTLGEIRDASIVGGCLMLGGMGLVAWGEQTVASGIAALFIGLMPMWLAIFARVLFGERLPALAVIGIAVGLAGVAILAWPVGSVGDLDPAGLLALIASPIFWSLGSLYSAKKAVLPTPALFATGLQMVAGGVLLLVAAFLTGELDSFSWAAVSSVSWTGLVYLTTVGSLVGFTTFAWLLTVAPLPRIATYAYVNPVVAVFLGWLIAGEPLTVRTGVAAVVIVSAVVLIVTARGRSTASAEPARVEVVAVPEGANAS